MNRKKVTNYVIRQMRPTGQDNRNTYMLHVLMILTLALLFARIICSIKLFQKYFMETTKLILYNYGITISRRFMIGVQLSVFVVYMKFTAGIIKFKECVGHLIAAISYFIIFTATKYDSLLFLREINSQLR